MASVPVSNNAGTDVLDLLFEKGSGILQDQASNTNMPALDLVSNVKSYS